MEWNGATGMDLDSSLLEGPDGVHQGPGGRFVVTGPGKYRARAMEAAAGHAVVTSSLIPSKSNGYAWRGYFSGYPETQHCWRVDGRYYGERETSFDLVARLPDEPPALARGLYPDCTDYCVGYGEHAAHCPNLGKPSATQWVVPAVKEYKPQRFGSAIDAMLDGRTVRIYSDFRIVDGVLETSLAGEPWKKADSVGHDAILSDKWEIL